jgi:photosystem II stability/assembly factor-like uncharacterized protein
MKKLILFLTLLILFSFQTLNAQWTQFSIPLTGDVYDMFFINPNTGWMTLLSPYNLIKTTSGGVNWNVIQVESLNRPAEIQFFNDTVGIGIGFDSNLISYTTKTINGGYNWNRIYSTNNVFMNMDFVNKDTGWVCGYDGNNSLIWRTTDGGVSFQLQYSQPGTGFDKIFMLKEKVNGEYWGWILAVPTLLRTTNSGLTWNLQFCCFSGLCGNGNYDMLFVDTLNGIVTRSLRCFSKTSNGGFNWTDVEEFHAINSRIGMGNKNIIWITLTTDSVLKTINFFDNYGKQPLPILGTSRLFAYDTTFVWGGAYGQNVFAKSTNGGGPIIYVGIDSSKITVPAEFVLSQNYPNPFNPQTTISFSLSSGSYVTLTIYDVLGKEVVKVIDNEQIKTGNYKAVIDFDKLNVSSGAYFYRLIVTDETGKEIKYNKAMKMVYLK